MNTKRDITTEEDVKLLVDTFYAKVKEDETLSPVFFDRIGNHWDHHLEKLYSFWTTVLFTTPGYQGKPMEGHFSMNIDQLHFDLWLATWEATIDELYEGERADKAKKRGKSMSVAFMKKIQQNR